MSWDEVTALVLRAQTGDRAAYGELVERFQGSVYAMALTRTRDPLEAQELAQEVFVHGMRKVGQLRDPRCFAGWLRRITARMAINRHARACPGGTRPRTGGESEMLDNVAGVEAEPLDQLERAEARSGVVAALHDLKPADRATLEAFYLRGQSLKEIAEEFDVPVGTVKRRLHVARQRLKGVYDDAETVAAPVPAKPRKKRELAAV